MTQLTGATRIRHVSRFLVLPLVGAMVLTLLVPYAAQAVHDTGIFQLDGDAQSATNTAQTPPANDDWDKVCNQATGGGSKDPLNIDQWAWKDGAGGLPDKDNLEHGFAARYSIPASGTCPNGTGPTFTGTCELIYFGSDRFDNSGDAQQGFWFFQNRITLGSNKVGGATGFDGLHKDGDVLVISDFSNGGGTSTIAFGCRL